MMSQDQKEANCYGSLLLMAILTAAASREGLTGMKKFYPAKLKQPKPQRVINPNGIHSAKLHPRQSLKIVLSPVKSYSSFVGDNARLEIGLNSDNLFIEKVKENKKGQTVYYVAQKYDMTQWSSLSEVFLGEVYVNIVDNDHPEAHKCLYKGGTVCVFHVPEESANNDVLTVLNPDANTIKLEPHRVLEVVLFERDWNNDEANKELWTPTIDDIAVNGESGIHVKILHQKTFDTDDLGNEKIKEGDFLVVPRWQPPEINVQLKESDRATYANERDRLIRPFRQHHFWLAFTETSRKNITRLKNGDYPCAKIDFTGTARVKGNRERSKREFVLMVSKHGKPVSGSKMLTSALQNRIPNDLTKREFDRTRGVLTNPGNVESVDFHSHFEEILVEIASPKAYWANEPAEARWQIAVEEGKKELEIHYLPDHNLRGVSLQRFRVKRCGTTETDKLGAVTITYPPRRNYAQGSRRLSFWMNFKKKSNSSIYAPATFNSAANSGSAYVCGEFLHWKKGLGYFDPDAMKLAVVAIEEIPTTSLESGVHTTRTRYNNTWREISTPHYEDNSKKNVSKNGAGQSSPTSGSGRNSIQTITESGLEPIEMVNPQHMQEVTLNPGQPLILRLTPPDESLPEQHRAKCKGEVWTVSPMAIGDVKPLIEYQKIVQYGTDRFRQEIKINPPDLSRLPSARGDAVAGAIRMECSALNRVVRIHVRKDATERKYQPTDIGDFLENLPTHEANGLKYLFADKWEDDQSVLIETKEVLYVKSPPSPEGFDRDWSIQLIQNPIPGEVWEKLSTNVRKAIDLNRPWFNREKPAEIRGTLVFKPLAETADPILPDMLKQIGEATRLTFFPVAKVMFEKFTTQTREEDGFEIESVVKVRRSLQICVKTGYKASPGKQSQIIYWPDDGKEFAVKEGETFSVVLRTIKTTFGDEMEEKHWEIKSHPTIIESQEEDNTGRENDRFVFKARQVGAGWLYFRCHGKETKIWIGIV